MGAWDYAIFDNDAALEVVDRWAEWMEGPKAIGYEKAIKRFFQYWGNAVEYGDPITNCEIIALLGIHLRDGIDVPPKLRDASINAISGELEPGELASWTDPAKREGVLRGLLTTISAEPRKRKRLRFFRDEALEYRSIAAARRDLLERAHKLRKKGFGGALFGHSYFLDFPPFLGTLQRYMNHRVWEKDFNISEHARIERCMMLAWYVAMSTRMSVEQMEVLFDEIEATTDANEHDS